jgi:hypothetical protein
MDGILVSDFFFLDIIINCFNIILSEINYCGRKLLKSSNQSNIRKNLKLKQELYIYQST